MLKSQSNNTTWLTYLQVSFFPHIVINCQLTSCKLLHTHFIYTRLAFLLQKTTPQGLYKIAVPLLHHFDLIYGLYNKS
jgi:hypothetical protein